MYILQIHYTGRVIQDASHLVCVIQDASHLAELSREEYFYEIGLIKIEQRYLAILPDTDTNTVDYQTRNWNLTF